jgi:hypothetical protein
MAMRCGTDTGCVSWWKEEAIACLGKGLYEVRGTFDCFKLSLFGKFFLCSLEAKEVTNDDVAFLQNMGL